MKIERGYPAADGFYVGWIADWKMSKKIKPYLLEWKKSGWYFSGSGTVCAFTVKGWVGPVPEYTEATALDFDL